MRSNGRSHVLGRVLRFIFVLGMSLMAGSVMAQMVRGMISGRVTDSAGAVLRAARVEVQPGGEFAITDDLGQFAIGDLGPGDYNVTVTYAGFAPFTASTKVVAGQTARRSGGPSTKQSRCATWRNGRSGSARSTGRRWSRCSAWRRRR